MLFNTQIIIHTKNEIETNMCAKQALIFEVDRSVVLGPS